VTFAKLEARHHQKNKLLPKNPCYSDAQRWHIGGQEDPGQRRGAG
jgi:hypothetical protein